jgi:hypothetical protein
MDTKTIAGQAVEDEGTAALSNPGAHPGKGEPAPDETTPRYQVILRHLAKFRDGARALLDVFGDPASAAAAAPSVGKAPPMSEAPSGAEKAAVPVPEPKSPLQVRIERHMGAVDRALVQIREVNPAGKKKAELAPELREVIVQREQTIRDIVSAELYFWSASIQNSPLDKFDETERAWIARILRLGKILGVDADHQQDLDFLRDWASQVHS